MPNSRGSARSPQSPHWDWDTDVQTQLQAAGLQTRVKRVGGGYREVPYSAQELLAVAASLGNQLRQMATDREHAEATLHEERALRESLSAQCEERTLVITQLEHEREQARRESEGAEAVAAQAAQARRWQTHFEDLKFSHAEAEVEASSLHEAEIATLRVEVMDAEEREHSLLLEKAALREVARAALTAEMKSRSLGSPVAKPTAATSAGAAAAAAAAAATASSSSARRWPVPSVSSPLVSPSPRRVHLSLPPSVTHAARKAHTPPRDHSALEGFAAPNGNGDSLGPEEEAATAAAAAATTAAAMASTATNTSPPISPTLHHQPSSRRAAPPRGGRGSNLRAILTAGGADSDSESDELPTARQGANGPSSSSRTWRSAARTSGASSTSLADRVRATAAQRSALSFSASTATPAEINPEAPGEIEARLRKHKAAYEQLKQSPFAWAIN
jgi:hypothetical protein